MRKHGVSADADVASTRSFNAYLKDAKSCPVLTREEELQIAQEYVRTRDTSLGYRLVTANLLLVVKIANRYKGGPAELTAELIQEGNLGLIEALNLFDPSRELRFSTYADYWVTSFMLKFIRNNSRLVRLGTTKTQSQIFFNIGNAYRELNQLGVESTPEALAAHLNVPVSDVQSMIVRLTAKSEQSLEEQDSSDASSTRTLADTLSSSAPTPDVILENVELQAWFHTQLQTFEQSLSDVERDVFRSRRLVDRPVSREKLAVRHSVTPEWTRRLETNLIRRFRLRLTNSTQQFLED